MKKKGIDSILVSEELLAEERTVWTNEQTTLAYIRTGFSALLLGIGILGLIKLSSPYKYLVYGGVISLTLGIIFIILGLIYYPMRNKKIKSMSV